MRAVQCTDTNRFLPYYEESVRSLQPETKQSSGSCKFLDLVKVAICNTL